MNKSITRQLGIIISIMFFISFIAISISNYYFTYRQTYESAGVEAYGCANITTGLIDPADLEDIINGDSSKILAMQHAIDWTTDHKHIFEDQYVISQDGTIIVADSNLEQQGFSAGDTFHVDHDAIQHIIDTKTPAYSEVYHYGGMDRLTGYAPIFKDHDPSKEIIAFSAIDFDAKIITDRTINSIKGSVFVSFLFLLIACFITILLLRRRTKPITTLINYARTIADGNLTEDDIVIKNKDEIGDLATTLNTMASSLRDVIGQVSNNAEQVALASNELSDNTGQTNQAAHQIATTTQNLADQVERQVHDIENAHQIVNDLSNHMNEVSARSTDVAQTTSLAADRALDGEKTIGTAIVQMEEITETVDKLAQIIDNLGNRSNEINQIIDVITDIADQTNLLALNAAIEAARAGESGRGFAIVAEEVRQLAEQSTSSAQQISELINTIQQETSDAIKSMDSASTEVTEGIAVINSAGQSFEQIHSAINTASEQTNSVTITIEQMAQNVESIVKSIDLIREVAEITAGSSEEVFGSTEEQLAATEQVESLVRTLEQLVEASNESIARFRLP